MQERKKWQSCYQVLLQVIMLETCLMCYLCVWSGSERSRLLQPCTNCHIFIHFQEGEEGEGGKEIFLPLIWRLLKENSILPSIYLFTVELQLFFFSPSKLEVLLFPRTILHFLIFLFVKGGVSLHSGGKFFKAVSRITELPSYSRIKRGVASLHYSPF